MLEDLSSPLVFEGEGLFVKKQTQQIHHQFFLVLPCCSSHSVGDSESPYLTEGKHWDLCV